MPAQKQNRDSVDWDACLAVLTAGARALGVRTSSAARAAMLEYLRHLERWNATYNLTAVRRPADMVLRHLLDSLAAFAYVRGARVVDVGSGAGLPGIPLALTYPRKTVVLLESNGKKAAFLRHMVRTLGMSNAKVAAVRAEAYRPLERFDTVICRAFAAVPQTLEFAGHLCAPRGRLVLMKGRDPSAELATLPAGFRVQTMAPLYVPGLNAERHVAVLEPGLL